MSWLLLGVIAALGLANADIPDYFKPLSYDLTFVIDLDKGTDFQGTTLLKFETSNNLPFNVTEIVLHSLELQITTARIYYPQGREDTLELINTNEKDETISFRLKESVKPKQEYTLSVEYKGSLNGTEGLFLAEYNKQRYLSMKTYPVYSRKLYPCFDKPNLRATYVLHLEITHSSSTDPVIVTGFGEDGNVIKASNTLKANYTSPLELPPYGVYFTVGSYKKPDKSKQVYFPTGVETRNQDLWDSISATIVSNLIKSAGVSIKSVVVPGLNVPFVSGYGISALSPELITLQTNAPIEFMKDVALQMLQASVQPFFTTIVSPSSWENLWLAESIPAYIAHETFNKEMKTNWGSWPNTLVLELQQSALSNSWSSSSSPIIADNLNTSSKVVEFLSDPAILKGSALLGMLETKAKSSLTTFVSYVKDMKGKSVSTQDFLTYYSNQNMLNNSLPDGKTIWDVFGSWLVNSGYPYLTVYRSDSQIVVNKKPFGISDNTGWMLPLTYQTTYLSNVTLLGATNVISVWLDDQVNGNSTLINNNTTNLLAVFNVEGPGLYRVLYDEKSLKFLQKELQLQTNSSSDFQTPGHLRTTLISDIFAFARRGLLSYASVFDTLNFMSNEFDLEPWSIASRGFKQLWTLIYFTDLRLPFQNYVTDLMRPAYLHYGLSTDVADYPTDQIVKILVHSMCEYEDEVCRRETKEAYKTYIAAKKNLANGAIADELYCNEYRDVTDSKTIDDIFKSYKTLTTKYQKQSLFYYLACAGGEDKASEAITSLLNNVLVSTDYETMPKEDMVLAFKQIASRPQHYVEALTFLKDNFYEIRTTLDEEKKADLIRYLGTLGSTDDHINILRNFTFKNESSSDVKEAAKDAIKSVEENKQFLIAHYTDMYNGLWGIRPTSTKSPDTTTGPTTNSPGTTTPTSGGSSQTAIVFPALLLISALILRYLH